jgi:hypothetical protein
MMDLLSSSGKKERETYSVGFGRPMILSYGDMGASGAQ